MLIIIFIFNKYYETLNKNTTINEEALKEIWLFIYSLNDNNLKKGFWQISEDNNDKLKVLDILTNNRGYNQEYPISNEFNYLNNSETFCMKYKNNIYCQLCNLNKVDEVFYNPLISINIKDITKQNLIEIIFSKFNGHEGSWENFSFTIDEKIKKKDIYHICKITTFLI